MGKADEGKRGKDREEEEGGGGECEGVNGLIWNARELIQVDGKKWLGKVYRAGLSERK